MTKCRYCGFEDSAYPFGYIKRYCDQCVSDKEIGVPNKPIETIFLQGYGHASVERIKEMERRVILPQEPTDGKQYYVGRKGENGKIQEREPSY